MKPGVIYGMQWDTMPTESSVPGDDPRVESQTITVQIFDTSIQIPDDEDPEVILLTPAMSPLEIKVVDNDQNKFTKIRATQAIIRFVSKQDQGQDITTFSDAYDNQFLVEITAGIDTGLFHGFLMLPDGSMAFQPDPQVVELTASDHLGALKEIAWTDDDGNVPSGKYRIADIVAQCLNKTGLSLNCQVVNNLRPGSGRFTLTGVDFLASTPGNMSFNAPNRSGWFYPGQKVTISGTTLNDGTYTVLSSNIVLLFEEPTVAETGVDAQFNDDSDGHFHDVTYLDAKTFEQEIGSTQDCYTVLEKILGDNCVLFQYSWEWWIVRIDEYEDDILYKATFEPNGVLVSAVTTEVVDFPIGFANNVLFANADQILTYERPHKYIKETFKYVSPLELVCNIAFERGDGDEPNPTQASETINFTLECWDFLREGDIPADLDQPPFTGSVGVLRKIYEYGYEKDRYAVTKQAGGYRHYFKSQSLPVEVGDKVELGVDFRLATTETMTNINPVHVRLIADNGDIYDWDYDQPSGVSFWQQKTASDPVFDNSFRVDWSGADTTEWYNVLATSLKMPATGMLYIRLLNGVDASFELWFSNLSLTYIPLVNGSYQKYGGHTNTVTRTDEGYLANREEEVFLGDAPKPVLKGGLFVEQSGNYFLQPIFYPAAKYDMTFPTDLTQVKPFGWHQAYAVWNQYRSAVRIFTGSVQGLGNPWPGLLHKYRLTDTNPNTINRYFLLISFTQDWKTGSWNGTFIECYRTDIGKSYDDPLEFKYLPGE